MKLTGTQLFILVVIGLAILAGVAYVDRAYVPILVASILTVLGVGLHVNGVNTGVPLSTAQSLPLVATLEQTSSEPGQAK